MMPLASQGETLRHTYRTSNGLDLCAREGARHLDSWLEMHSVGGSVRKRPQGIEGHDDPEFASG
ncbi:MAG: hypothetical protein A2V62_13595 [Nitrospirae bacterium RBG_19FT_COMBO_58_9]|nr:MAG: hypothetical protein A2V62_13595 [Nitrospirae bacterium RBG_19FT_COMBO_58_9]